MASRPLVLPISRETQYRWVQNNVNFLCEKGKHLLTTMEVHISERYWTCHFSCVQIAWNKIKNGDWSKIDKRKTTYNHYVSIVLSNIRLKSYSDINYLFFTLYVLPILLILRIDRNILALKLSYCNYDLACSKK